MDIIRVTLTDEERLEKLAEAAAEIWKEHYTSIIGAAQTEYMVEKFQSPAAIREQLSGGYRYYLVEEDGETAGFMGFYPREDCMYLSKLYLFKTKRGRGYSRKMVDFVCEAAKAEGLNAVELNVNRGNTGSIAAYEALGFARIREEKIGIGSGYYMDDYVYRLGING